MHLNQELIRMDFRMNVSQMNQIDDMKISIKCKQNGVKISLKLDRNQLFIYYNKIIMLKKLLNIQRPESQYDGHSVNEWNR